MSGETGLPTRWTVIRTGPLGRKEIIDVAGGPASFNAEMQVRGKRVVTVDPLYSFSPAEIEQRFYAASDGIMLQVRETPEDWVWTFHRSPEQLRARRVQALARFLADYGRRDSRRSLRHR